MSGISNKLKWKQKCDKWSFIYNIAVADPRGDPEARPPAPVKTSQKKDGCRAGPQVS